jgi:hypothetical protein
MEDEREKEMEKLKIKNLKGKSDNLGDKVKEADIKSWV